MARTVNPEGFAAKRKEILNATQQLVFTKGYEQMSLQDVLDHAGISSGAFHHYFDSREALLEAFITEIQQESEKPLLPILNDAHLSAIEKLQGFFNTLDSLRLSRKVNVVRLTQVWYTDANAVVRHKVDEAVFKQRAPMITAIVRQGVQEGVFNTPFPEKSGEVVLSLIQGMGNLHARQLLSLVEAQSDEQVQAITDEIVVTYQAFMDAVEQVLDAPAHSLARSDTESIAVWVKAMREIPAD